MNRVIDDRPATALTAVLTASATPDLAARPVAARPRERLSIQLGAAEHGIDILGVQEVLNQAVPTRIVDAPDFIKGVVNFAACSCPSSTCAWCRRANLMRPPTSSPSSR